MTPFLFRCPTTGMMVQSLHPEDEPREDDEETYVAISCLACSGTHLVNPTTGKVVGAEEE